MATQQQNPWHNTTNNNNNRSKTPATSRTPQNRSNTASPSPAAQQNPQQQTTPASHKPSQPPGNFWAQRATTQSRDSSNGPAPQQRQQSPATVAAPAPATAAAGFNAAEVKAFLARDAAQGDSAGVTYKVQVQEAAGGGKGNGGGAGNGGAKGGNKYSQTASNQPFFALLAKQIATLEGGG